MEARPLLTLLMLYMGGLLYTDEGCNGHTMWRKNVMYNYEDRLLWNVGGDLVYYGYRVTMTSCGDNF